MAKLTRRTFITSSAIGVGALAGAGSVSRLLAQTQSGCSISSNFNGTPIPGDDYIWFNSVLKVQGLDPQQPTTIGFAPMPITFTANGVPFIIPVPAATINFVPNLALATTDFDSVALAWSTNVPSSGLAGKVFLDGVALHVPAGGLPGGIKDVTWSGMFFSCTPGLTIQWQWAAAVYAKRIPGRWLRGARRQAGGRQSGELVQKLGSRRHAGEFPKLRRWRCQGRRRVEFHGLVQRHGQLYTDGRVDRRLLRKLAGAIVGRTT